METQAPPELDLRRYIEILRRRKVVISVVTLVMVGLAMAFSFRQTPVYEASTRILLRTTSAELQPGTSGNTGNRVATEIQVMESEAVRNAVREVLGYLPTVRLASVDSTSVISITAQATTAEDAAARANAYAAGYIEWRRSSLEAGLTADVEELEAGLEQRNQDLFVLLAPLQELEAQIATFPPDEEPTEDQQAVLDARDQLAASIAVERNDLETRIANDEQLLTQARRALEVADDGVDTLSPAEAPGSPLSPKPARNALLGLVIGLMLGMGVALVLEILDDRIRRKDDLVKASGGRNVLGMIPLMGRARRRGRDVPMVISVENPMSPVTEAYRTLRTSMQFLAVDEPVRFIQVTSPNASEGKTTTVANLGVALARAGQRVVVVCCDLRRPRIHEFYGLDNAVGFTSVLLGDAELDEAIQGVPGESRLQLLASGPPPPNPAELLSTRRTREVLDQVAERVDVVLVDSTPVLPVTDALLMSNLVDITLLVTKADSTTRRAVRRTVELLDQVDANLVGCVLNGTPLGGPYGYGDGYGYGYVGYGYRAKRSRRQIREDTTPASLERVG